ncbi:MAG: A/G-specific adenine glycosylase [Planctomycetota bacterium]
MSDDGHSTSDDGSITMLSPPSQWQQAAYARRRRKRLTDWFATAARPLPWREDPTPYKVWISEIMCQQTQIATVLPYFHRFLDRYPSVAELAAADEDELMRLWEGLGYYRRARSLKRAAEQIMDRHEGRFPTRINDVLDLAGIGRYTAGAILSISRNQPHPILEGNTVRVFSRWIGLQGDVKSKTAQSTLWSVAESMLPRRVTRDRECGPAAINQAAMELGALICTPRDPSCHRCPVTRWCAAHSAGLQREIPGKVSRIQYEARTEFALVLRDRSATKDDLLVHQIERGQRFAGMWDLPRVGSPHANSPETACDWLAMQLGVTTSPPPLSPGARLTTIKHGVTKYRMTLHVHDVGGEIPDVVKSSTWQWIPLTELAERPMSVTTRKIVRLLQHSPQHLLFDEQRT